ncbi:hypothetical protein [Paraburkholderia aromaticivorans]|uniref:Uncharacterized protein n=1 Tax=Paraburkholderia aromaticivorans TaxID=2026199 RepID=A0A248VDQ6_9BURK|nr:hypothetical protein [Paraburkholderia aromaticivorans]ASV96711.1 hypothetical protein CJU94_00065 [Paraburkholderia aromaticivorans]
MKLSKSFDRHGRAVENAGRLAEWCAQTALEHVPLNQFGESSKESICKMLGISRSTARSNPTMKAIFGQLDAEIAKMHARNVGKRAPEGNSKSGLTSQEINEALAELQTDNSLLRRKLNALMYLEDTGLDVRL